MSLVPAGAGNVVQEHMATSESTVSHVSIICIFLYEINYSLVTIIV